MVRIARTRTALAFGVKTCTTLAFFLSSSDDLHTAFLLNSVRWIVCVLLFLLNSVRHDVRLTVDKSSAEVLRAAAPVVFCFDGNCCCYCWFDLLLLIRFAAVAAVLLLLARLCWHSCIRLLTVFMDICHQMDPFAALGAAALARLLVFKEATALRRQ